MKVGDLVRFKCDVPIPDSIDHINQRTVEQVLNDGAIEITKQYSAEEHAYLIHLMDKSGKFHKELSEGEMLALASYFLTLDPPRTTALWAAVGNGIFKNSRVLHQYTVKKQSVSVHIVEVLESLPPPDANEGQTGVIISDASPVGDKKEKNWYQVCWTSTTITDVLDTWIEVISESR